MKRRFRERRQKRVMAVYLRDIKRLAQRIDPHPWRVGPPRRWGMPVYYEFRSYPQLVTKEPSYIGKVWL